jgi:hypothetical protein
MMKTMSGLVKAEFKLLFGEGSDFRVYIKTWGVINRLRSGSRVQDFERLPASLPWEAQNILEAKARQ